MLPSRYLDSCHANEGQGSSVSSYSAQTDCAASISVAVNEGRRWALASNNADNFQSFEFRLSTVRKMWPANKNTAPVDHTAPFYGTFITRDAASWHFMFFRPISCNKCQPNIGPHSTAPSGCYAKINRPRFQSAKDNATSIASKVSMSSRVSLSLSLAHSLVVGFRYLGCRYRIESRGNGNRVASIDTRKFCHPIKCFIFDGAVPRLVTGSHSWSRLILGWSSFRVPFFGFIRRGACLGSNNAVHQLKDADKYVPVVSALLICFPLSSPFGKKQLTASEEKRKL